MEAPFFSTFSAIAEIFVTIAVFYVVLTNYAQKGFPWKLATGVIIFEFSINMMYMIFRMRETAAAHDPATPNPLAPFMAAHGILSLVVFILFVVYSYLAYVSWKRGKHFFFEHKGITWSYLGMWMLSVGSGEALYIINYM